MVFSWMKLIPALALGANLLAPMQAESAQGGPTKEIECTTVKVGTVRHGKPLAYLDRSGQPAGVEDYLVLEIQRLTGCDLQFQYYGSAAEVLKAAHEGKIDLGYAGISRTRDRCTSYVTCLQPHLNGQLGIAYRKHDRAIAQKIVDGAPKVLLFLAGLWTLRAALVLVFGVLHPEQKPLERFVLSDGIVSSKGYGGPSSWPSSIASALGSDVSLLFASLLVGIAVAVFSPAPYVLTSLEELRGEQVLMPAGHPGINKVKELGAEVIEVPSQEGVSANIRIVKMLRDRDGNGDGKKDEATEQPKFAVTDLPLLVTEKEVETAPVSIPDSPLVMVMSPDHPLADTLEDALLQILESDGWEIQRARTESRDG